VDNPSAPRLTARLSTFRLILLAVVCAAAFGALILPDELDPAAQLYSGDVAPHDFHSPADITFESAVLTEQRRENAATAVAPVYAPPDPSISRKQVETLRIALNVVERTRADESLTLDQKRTEITSRPEFKLSDDSLTHMLTMIDARWDVVRNESLTVLEGTLRAPIHEFEVSTVRANLPSHVNLALDEEQAILVVELVAPFVAANSLESPTLTEAARAQARDNVTAVTRSFRTNEIVVRGGQVLSDVDIEALGSLGLIQTNPRTLDFVSAGAVTILCTFFSGIYFYRRKRLGFLYEARSLLVMAFLFIGFLIGARLVVPGNVLLPYIYPLPALGLLLAALFGPEAGIIVSLVVCILAAYGFSADLLPYYLLPSLCGVLALGPGRRFASFVIAGAAITGAALAVLLAYRIPAGTPDLLGAAQLSGAAALNGFLSAGVALLGQYFISQSLGLATALHLLDISRPDFPLLQQLLRKAPGTYQHSLQVSNLAEQAAEAIGADGLLVRVGALYHDVGKTSNAGFFIENQAPGQTNTHQDMEPQEAAAAIIQHVHDGVALARKYRLPRRIDDFILEHHGTMLTRYQYNQALERVNGDASQVDLDFFRYPGPRPRSRETALLMLADGSEARARAMTPKDENELRTLVHNVIDLAQQEGQLDHTSLTLSDLHIIAESFTATLRGTYHTRIQYPAAEPLLAAGPIATQPKK